MSLVSIIVPVFNVEKKLSTCVDALLKQTYEDVRIILINDGSTDKSGLICDEYSKIDRRVQTIHIKNSGVSAARNTGLEYANSPYVMFVDSDDKIESELVERLLDKALDEDADFVMCGYKKNFMVNDEIENVQHYPCKPYSGDIAGFLKKVEHYVGKPLLQGPCWKLFRRRIISIHNILFPEQMSYGEDAIFVYTYLKYVKNISTIDEELYCYNVYDNESLSRVFRKDKFEINLYLMQTLKLLFTRHKVEYDEAFFNNQICGFYISYIGEMWRCSEKINSKLRHGIIYNANEKQETQQAFKALATKSTQNRLLFNLIINKRITLIEFYFGIKEKVRKHINPAFKILMKLFK